MIANVGSREPGGHRHQGASADHSRRPESLIRGKSVLVVEDGPTLTHGEMKFGAGTIAARMFGASGDHRSAAVCRRLDRRDVRQISRTGAVLPAMGYGDEQVKDLEATINAVPCDTVVIGTPIDLRRVMKIKQAVGARQLRAGGGDEARPGCRPGRVLAEAPEEASRRQAAPLKKKEEFVILDAISEPLPDDPQRTRPRPRLRRPVFAADRPPRPRGWASIPNSTPARSPWTGSARSVPRGIILSGSPHSAYEDGAPLSSPEIFEPRHPGPRDLLRPSADRLPARRRSGPRRTARVRAGRTHRRRRQRPLRRHRAGRPAGSTVWMSHGDHLTRMPPGFEAIAHTANAPICAIRNRAKQHLRASSSTRRSSTRRRGRRSSATSSTASVTAQGRWSPSAFVGDAVESVRRTVGEGKVLCALSGGVDSSVAALLLHQGGRGPAHLHPYQQRPDEEGRVGGGRQDLPRHVQDPPGYVDASRSFP